MREGWEEKRLIELCVINPPKKEAKEKLNDIDLVTFLPMEDLGVLKKEITSNKERALINVSGSYTYFAENDVLLAKITPCFENGKIGIARKLTNGVGFGSSEYIVFRSKGEIISDYLYYFLSRETFREEGKKLMTGAVGHKRVSKEFIENYLLPFPKSLPEQQRIVAILDEAFAAIAKAKANAEQNLKNAKELFESYLQGVFEQRREGWRKYKVSELCESIIDCVNKTAPIVPEETDYKMIRTTNIRFGQVDLTTVRYVAEDTYKEWTRRQKPQKGDILFTREAPMGEVGMLCTNDKVFLGQRIVSYRVDKMKVDPKFLLLAFQSLGLKKQIDKLASGATVQHLRVPHTKEFEFNIPPLIVQQSIVQKLDALSAQTKKLEAIYQQKLNDLEELKKSILQKAFSGELKTLNAVAV